MDILELELRFHWIELDFWKKIKIQFERNNKIFHALMSRVFHFTFIVRSKVEVFLLMKQWNIKGVLTRAVRSV